jgi:hypothetical protein
VGIVPEVKVLAVAFLYKQQFQQQSCFCKTTTQVSPSVVFVDQHWRSIAGKMPHSLANILTEVEEADDNVAFGTIIAGTRWALCS